MKKKKIINIIILIILFMFTFNTNVKAKDYAYCYYKHNTNEKDGDKYTFPIYKRQILSNPNKNLIIIIRYNSDDERISTPKIWAKIIDTDISLETTNDFKNAMSSSSGFSIPNTARYPDYAFNNLPNVNIANIMNNSDEMMCPNVYLYGKQYSTENRYVISLFGETNPFSEEYTFKKELTPLGISKVSSGIVDSKPAFNCSYNIKDYRSTIFNFSGVLGFDVDKDGHISNIIANNTILDLDLRYEGDKLTECPTYIKLDYHAWKGYTDIKIGTKDSYDGVYNGDISTGEDNQNLDTTLIAKYTKYASNGSNYITVEKVAGNYNFNMNGKGSTSLNISNANDYKSAIESQDANQMPKYIVKLEGETEYQFLDSAKSENGESLEIKELYINTILFSTNGTGLTKEEEYDTCYALFGTDFLNLLDQYVFKIIWIGVPILLIILTTFDFAKVVLVDDKEGIQNAFARLWKRAIVSILIFLTPYIIILITNIIDPTQTTVSSCAKKIREMGNTTFIVK